MANTVRLKRSAVQGKAPVVGDLALGELAVNTYDGKLYTKKNDGSDSIVEIGGDAETLDGLDSTQFVRSDAADVITGNLTWNDSFKALFGASNDLQIYHDGINSYISQDGTGDLFIRNTTDDLDVIIQSDDGAGGTATYFRADGSAGDVILYHYGSPKFATKSYGAEVTGDIIISGDTGIGATSPTNKLHVKETNTNTIVTVNESSAAASYVSFVDTGTTAGNVRCGSIGDDFVVNAGGVQRMRIDSSGNVGIGTSSPSENLEVLATNSATIRLRSNQPDGTASNAVFAMGDAGKSNSPGGIRYAVNVSGDASLGLSALGTSASDRQLTIQDSGDVGIGTTNPSRSLHVINNAAAGVVGRIESTGTRARIAFKDTNTTTDAYVGVGSIGDVLALYAGNSERMRIDDAGNVGIGKTPSVILDIDGTDAIQVPVGTTAQRPGTPANGQQRYNSDLGVMEAYVQGQWQPVQTDENTAKTDVAQTFTAQQTFGELKEGVYTLATTGSIALDPANGSIQTTVLTGAPTFTNSLESGQAITLHIENGSTYTVTWPAITWVTSGGNTAPTLTAKDVVALWQVSTVLYGAYVGSYA